MKTDFRVRESRHFSQSLAYLNPSFRTYWELFTVKEILSSPLMAHACYHQSAIELQSLISLSKQQLPVDFKLPTSIVINHIHYHMHIDEMFHGLHLIQGVTSYYQLTKMDKRYWPTSPEDSPSITSRLSPTFQHWHSLQQATTSP